jgi:DNA-binding IclR family transcriptional regulator
MADIRYLVPGLERGLKLLELFDRQRTTLGATEAARRLSVPRSSAFRLIQTLEHMGFLERVGTDYRLGAAVLRLGFEYVASLPLTDLARPVVEKLRDDTGCSAQLAIRDEREIVFVARVNGPSSFSSSVAVGTRMPAHATAMGRMFLAYLPEDKVRALYQNGQPERYWSNTPGSVATLLKMLREDRHRGYVVSESVFERGISAIAAPVREGSGGVVAAVSVTVHQPTVEPRELRERLIRQVREAADELSYRLNYRPVAEHATGEDTGHVTRAQL